MGLNYETREFSLEDVTKPNSIIKVPQFQRGLVWTIDNQKNFIRTMMDGDPFGSILLSKNGNDEFLLIDGLQRISTIRRFISKPEQYIDTKFINEEILSSIIDLYKARNLVPRNKIVRYMEEVKHFVLKIYNESNSAVKMAKKFIENYDPHNLDIPNIYTLFDELYTDMEKKIKLNSAIIPAIIYTGDDKNLPDVFERMNTGAVTLSKYEVLASTWYPYEIEIEDEEISKYVKMKYSALRDKSMLEVIYDEEELDKKINIFEYCYAISEILKDKNNGFTAIFGEKKKELSTDSIGFELITVLLGFKVNEANNIKDFLYYASPGFLSDFKEAIKDVAKEISKIMVPWLSYKTTTGIKILNTITGYQAIHIFVSLFNLKYSLNIDNHVIVKKESKKELNNFRRYLPLNVLFDVVRDYWGLNRQVSDLHANLTDERLLNRYIKAVNVDDLATYFIEYIKAANENLRVTIPSDTKFILNQLHILNIKTDKQYWDSFNDQQIDFEHITPRDRVKSLEGQIPVSSIANLCVMLPRDNRSKKSLTLYEDEKYRASYDLSERILDLMVYPKKSELGFLDLNDEQKIIKFETFVHDRTNTLTHELERVVKKYYNL